MADAVHCSSKRRFDKPSGRLRLQNKTTSAVCKFLLEDVICRYGCVGKITADRGELDTDKARKFFGQIGVKLALPTAYNPEGNKKSERGHPPIV